MSARTLPAVADVASSSSIVPYVGPIVIFGIFGAAEGYLPVTVYPAAYVIKVIAVTAALWYWREALRDLRFSASVVLPAVAVGLVVFVSWIAIDKLIPYPHLGSRVGFDPTSIASDGPRLAFIGIRLAGLALMVPVMEEVFWRSFLLRYVTNERFRSIPIGTFSTQALAVVLAASMIAHSEWIAAGVANLAYSLFLKRSRSLFSVVLAHAVTNAALGAYILATREWQYW